MRTLGRWGFARGVTLSEPLSWLYWLIELGSIVGVATVVAVEAAKKPFCEACRAWYRGGKHQRSVATINAERFVTLVESGNFHHAGMLIGDGATPPNLEMYVQQCPRADEHNAILSVRRTSENVAGRLQFTDLFEDMLTPQQVAELHSGRHSATGTMVLAS